MTSDLQNAFLSLVRLGISAENNTGDSEQFQSIDWAELLALAQQHGLEAVVLDGIEKMPLEQRPPKKDLLQWIGEVMLLETQNAIQQKTAAAMAMSFKNNSIRTYVLKGLVVAECYPKPRHRFSVDMDCFLLPDNMSFDAWRLGNELIMNQGFEVGFDFYKNSTFYMPGLTVENHQYMVPFRGNKLLAKLEKLLQGYMSKDKGEDIVEGTSLYRPPMVVTSLFLIEHAYSHFLHEGLTWRHVLDWMMFSRKHYSEIDWAELMEYVDEFGFRKFYDSYERLGRYLICEKQNEELTDKDKLMLGDIWAPLDLHETVHGFKGKLSIAGNTLRARWKYHHFADISMTHALWIQVKGFMFIKHPKI